MKSRRYSLTILSTACLFLASPALRAESPAADQPPVTTGKARPNILFFLADDQRNDTLGCAGHPIIKTPNIDRLAESGVHFTNACVTTSICAASRASIFTGLHERTHGYTFDKPPVRTEHSSNSYPALLRKAGYRTGFSGKFGIMVAGAKQAIHEMFDEFKPISPVPFRNKQGVRLRHETDLNGDFAVEFIKSNPANQPFCLSISFCAPHAIDGNLTPGSGHYPWPESSDALYIDTLIPAPHLSDPKYFEALPDFLKHSMNRERYFWRWDTPEKYQVNMRAYLRMLSGIDHAIGRVLKTLKDEGLADNTVIIYAADNGYYMGDRGLAGKWSHFEQSLRIPLIIYDPRQKPLPDDLHRVDAPTLNIDLAPTFLSLAGVPCPDLYQGASLLPYLEGKKPTNWRSDSFHEHLMDNDTISKWEGVREHRYVYARYFEQNPPYEFLHDLKVDPEQITNFRDKPEYRETLERLRKRCDTLRDSYKPEPDQR